MSINEDLMKAAESGEADTVKKLLDAGADVEAIDRKIGFTALSHGAYSGGEDVVSLLLEHGADVNRQDNLGCPPLFYAVMRGRFHTAKLLLDKGADINAQCGQSSVKRVSILQRIINSGNSAHLYADDMIKRVEFMVEHGADVHSLSVSTLREDYGKYANEIISLLEVKKPPSKEEAVISPSKKWWKFGK